MSCLPVGRETGGGFQKGGDPGAGFSKGWEVTKQGKKAFKQNGKQEWKQRYLLKRQQARARSWNVMNTRFHQKLGFYNPWWMGKHQRLLSREGPWLDKSVRWLWQPRGRMDKRRTRLGLTFLLLWLAPFLTPSATTSSKSSPCSRKSVT